MTEAPSSFIEESLPFDWFFFAKRTFQQILLPASLSFLFLTTSLSGDFALYHNRLSSQSDNMKVSKDNIISDVKLIPLLDRLLWTIDSSQRS